MPRFWQRIKGLFGITFGVAGAGSWQYAQDWLRGLFHDQGAVDRPYAQHATVAIAIERIATDSASIEWELFPEDDEEHEEPVDHPVLDLWNNPNPQMVGSDLWIATYTSFLLFGEWFWYYPGLTLGTRGGPRATQKAQGELNVLDPRAVMHRFNEQGEVEWSLRVNGEDMPLDSRFLCQGKRHNPYVPGYVRGLSKLDAIRVEIEGDVGAANWNSRYFNEQNAIPSGVITPSQGSMMTADQRRELRETWRQRHGGTKRSVAVLPPGWQFNALGISQNDMGFLNLRNFARDQILSMIGPVPPLIAGFLDVTIKYNAKEQKEVYWLGTIPGFLGQIQEVLNYKFLPSIGITNLEAYPKYEAVKAMVENFDEKVDTAVKLFGMGFPKDQINERLELGFDTDELEDADVGYLPLNLMPVSLINEPPEPAPPMEAVPVADDDMERAVRGNGDAREHRRSLLWKNIILRTRDLEDQFGRVFRSHFKDIEREVLANLEGFLGLSWRGGVLKQSGSNQVFDVDEATLRLRKRTKPIHKAAIKRGGESVIADLGLSIVFNLEDPRIIAKLAEISQNIKGVNERLEFALRSELIAGLGESETIDKLRDRVARTINASLGRSRTIARTETGFAFNSGRNISMKQAGIQRHEWLSARDGDVRDTHAAEDGQQVAIGEAFPVTGLMYPNDPSGPPAEIINCRCVALPVVER